jgi:hypothetical protein
MVVTAIEEESRKAIAPLQHLELAEEFYKAFRDLPRDGPSGAPINWPRYFALCHATELALKAFLLAHGIRYQQIEKEKNKNRKKEEKKIKLAHDISVLMEEAIARGMHIGPLARSEIELLSKAHKEYWPRYPEARGPVFVIDHFETYVIELLTAVALAIRMGNRLYVKY